MNSKAKAEIKTKYELRGENMTEAGSRLSRKEIDNHFNRLDKTLRVIEVNTKKGPTRKASASEFMLMEMLEEGVVSFKHSISRQYLFLLPTGEIHIPTTKNPHLQGFFDLSF